MFALPLRLHRISRHLLPTSIALAPILAIAPTAKAMATSTSSSSDTAGAGKVAIVVGVGGGLGESLVKRFSKGGYSVGIVARSDLTSLAEQIQKGGNNAQALAVSADVGDEQALRKAIQQIHSKFGPAEVLIYNAGAYAPGGVMELKPSQLLNNLNVGAVGLLTAAQEVVPNMQKQQRGSILITGATASLRGSKGFAGLAVPKFALRGLSQSMARELQPQGIHVAHVLIDGQIATPRQVKAQPDRDHMSFLDPDQLAEQYWNLHTQHKTVWTQELDVRPFVEKW